ncbi:MAG: glycosyltransferase [Nitrososphaerota archaeon]|jgi:glycosyltransferase involved in cell wall biosynthesis|nr:glycosyltransferase [Nitrososphaerota archaeon]
MVNILPDVLVTLPVHNEVDRIYLTTHLLADALDDSGLNYALSIAEDGSTDGTQSVVRKLEAEIPTLIVQSLPRKVGRGLALRKLWSKHSARIFAFMDADLATSPTSLIEVIHTCQSGIDVVSGSRYVPGAVVRRPPARLAVSKGYNALVRMLFQVQTRDHQCGLKAFTSEAVQRIMPLCREDSWVWDTEVLVVAAYLGLQVREVPVSWTEFRNSKTPWKRLLSDVQLHGTALIRLKSSVQDLSRPRMTPPSEDVESITGELSASNFVPKKRGAPLASRTRR